MTVKLLLLKSGEDIIANVSEMTIGEGENTRVIGYFLEKPCTIRMSNQSIVSEDDSEKKAQIGISLYPWIPLTKDDVIPITADWVITMTNPADNLEEMYIKDVLKNGKNDQSDSTGEQSDSDKSD
jgi:hypothetical protein